MEENLANPGMRTSQQDGKRRKEQAVSKTITRKKKRLKLESGEEIAWGEVGSAEEEERRKFIYATPMTQLLSCLEWICRSVLKEVLENAVEMSKYMRGVESWEEWEEEATVEVETSKRSLIEERKLWRILDECDREQAKGEERRLNRERKKVQQARLRRKTGKDQLSMKEMMMVCKGVVPGDCLSGITSRIGVSLDEEGCKNLKTLGALPPQECPDTSLPAEMKTGGAASKIAFRIGASRDKGGGKIQKTLEA